MGVATRNKVMFVNDLTRFQEQHPCSRLFRSTAGKSRAFAVGSMLRLLSVALPLGDVSVATRVTVVGAPILIAIVFAMRATGTGFCFNGGRLVAAPMLWFSGWLKALPGMDLRQAVSWLGLVFLLGVVVVLFLPETRGQPLPE